MHTKYQPTVFNIKGPCCRVQCFCCIKNSVHLEDFQHKGRRWAYHQGMTSVMRVAHYFLLLCDGEFWGPSYKATQSKSQYCGCTLYAHHIFNIKGPCCTLQCFCWIENKVNLKDFQHREWRWVYHKGMTRVTRVAHYLLPWCGVL